MAVLRADATGRAARLGVVQGALVGVLVVAVGFAAVDDLDGRRVLAFFAAPELLKMLVAHGSCKEEGLKV